MYTDPALHANQNTTRFFKHPKIDDEKFICNVLITILYDYVADPNNHNDLIACKVETYCHGSFLSIPSANTAVEYWCIFELGDDFSEQEDDCGRPTQNMWPGFWVPEGTTKAEMRKLPDDTVQIDVTVGRGREKMCYHIKAEVSEVF